MFSLSRIYFDTRRIILNYLTMSNRYGQVLKTLATKGDLPVLPAGQTLEDLAVGQIGFFSYPGDVSIDGTENHRNFYIGVGKTADDVEYSGGQFIQAGNIKNITFRPHTPAQPQVTRITDFCGSCDEDYILSVQFENQEIYRSQGFVQFTKNFNFKAACCNTCGCSSCECNNDCNLVAKGLWKSINQDRDGLVVAVALDDTGAPLADEAAIDAYMEAQATAETAAAGTGKCMGLELTGVEMAIRENCGINLNYFWPRGTKFTVLGKAGFKCNLKVENTQEVAFAEGSGHDINHREYQNATNNAGADSYYYSNPMTMSLTEFDTMSDKNVNYDQFAIEVDHTTSSAWLEYNNAVATVIAVPATDAITSAGIAGVFDAIGADLSTGFDAILPAVSAAVADETIVEPTGDKTEETDGITS